jgi:hypothetical protein
VIFSLIKVIKKQKGAMLYYIKYIECLPIELINHLIYQPFHI